MLPIPYVGHPATTLHLGQPWRETLEPDFAPASGLLNWSDTHLHIQLDFTDAHVFSTSTAHNQNLFLLGDTAEVFLLLPDAPHYYELHVTPHNHRTHLRWPLGSIDEARNGTVSIDNFKENPGAFDSRVYLNKTGWQIHFDIPPALLGLECFERGQSLLVSLCRYDYRDLDTPPVVSTASAHQVKNFHLTADWLAIELV